MHLANSIISPNTRPEGKGMPSACWWKRPRRLSAVESASTVSESMCDMLFSLMFRCFLFSRTKLIINIRNQCVHHLKCFVLFSSCLLLTGLSVRFRLEEVFSFLHALTCYSFWNLQFCLEKWQDTKYSLKVPKDSGGRSLAWDMLDWNLQKWRS